MLQPRWPRVGPCSKACHALLQHQSCMTFFQIWPTIQLQGMGAIWGLNWLSLNPNSDMECVLSKFNGGFVPFGNPVLLRHGSLVEAGLPFGPAPARGAHGPKKTGRFSSSFPSSLISQTFPPRLPQANKPLLLSRNNVLFDQSAGETLHQLHSFPLSVALHQSLLCYILVLTSRTGRGPSRPSLRMPADA